MKMSSLVCLHTSQRTYNAIHGPAVLYVYYTSYAETLHVHKAAKWSILALVPPLFLGLTHSEFRHQYNIYKRKSNYIIN